MRNIFAFLTGSLFGVGLLVSGMTNVSKVQGWLDIFGEWDPTLAFVLGGAIIPMAIAWRVAARRPASVCGSPFPGAASKQIGLNLVLGSFLFGAGWGLAGLCPGPSLASLSFDGVGGVVFLATMTAGLLIALPIKNRIDRFSVQPVAGN